MKPAMTKAAGTARGIAEVAASAAPAEAMRCPHTAVLASLIADDAGCLIELLTDLIGEAVEFTNELACARVKLARIGMVAQQIDYAHRGPNRRPGLQAKPVHWVLHAGGTDADIEAWEALGRRAAP